jgi:hypothetical protein
MIKSLVQDKGAAESHADEKFCMAATLRRCQIFFTFLRKHINHLTQNRFEPLARAC